MKKIISWCLCLTLLFNIGVTAFAEKGKPLTEHPEYTGLIYKFFEGQESEHNDPECPAVWVKESKFLFWDKDYRTVSAYNIPLLMEARDRKDSFFHATAKVLLKSRQAAVIAERIARATGKPVLTIFKKLLREELKKDSSEIVAVIADFLKEIDEKEVIDSIISGMGMTFYSQLAHGISIVACLTNVLEILKPVAGIAAAGVLDLICIFSTKAALENQKVENYSTVFKTFFNMMYNDPEHVKKSNLFVTAIDERKFCPILRYNAFRRNDGAWCDFVHIEGLRCAPIAGDYKEGRLINTYLDIYRRIMRDERLDLKKLDDYLKGCPAPGTNPQVQEIGNDTQGTHDSCKEPSRVELSDDN